MKGFFVVYFLKFICSDDDEHYNMAILYNLGYFLELSFISNLIYKKSNLCYKILKF